MAVPPNNETTYNPDLYLSPDQQDLLLAALSSNKPNASKGSSMATGKAQIAKSNSALPQNGQQPRAEEHSTDVTINGQYVSPIQRTPGYADFGSVGLDDSPFLDFDLEDGSFDWDNSGDQLIGNIPGTSLNNDELELHDKRKSPDDDNDEDGGGKRREGDDKSSKKPGRKPLTSEPTTKRKAQNRAAQRAFRERKERHLKDLETKVDELEKASESANHENGVLRAQVEQLQAELKGYRKRLSYNGGDATGRPAPLGASRPSSIANNIGSNNNFQFEFPKFGDLPGSQIFTKSSLPQKNPQREQPPIPKGNGVTYQVPGVVQRQSFGSVSRKDNPRQSEEAGMSPATSGLPVTPWPSSAFPDVNTVEDLTGLFSPSILQTVSRSGSQDYVGSKGSNVTAPMNSRRSTASSHGQNSVPQLNGGSTSSITTSPSASSVSQHGPGSSCGTSPEPGSYSPTIGKVADNNLNTINEEHQVVDASKAVLDGQDKPQANVCSTMETTAKTATSDINGIDWMAQQNGGQFDPMLFGNYRESQDAVLNNDFAGFFDEAFPFPDIANFGSPLSLGNIGSPAPRKDLLKETDDQKDREPEPVPAQEPKMLSCNKIWDQLQKSPLYQNGELDVDSLCAELRTKAKCSETGLALNQKEVDDVLKRIQAR